VFTVIERGEKRLLKFSTCFSFLVFYSWLAFTAPLRVMGGYGSLILRAFPSAIPKLGRRFSFLFLSSIIDLSNPEVECLAPHLLS
jgi:hypothetical protein